MSDASGPWPSLPNGSEASLELAAVLWDMDGTLVDTEPYWIATEFALAEEFGASWSQEHALNLVGNDLLVSGAYIQRVMGLPLSAEQIVERLLDGVVAQMQAEVPWRPGARELLADLRAHDVPCALVTMSYRRFVQPMLDQLPDDTFEAVITGDIVSAGKPDPEPYLAAARALGVPAPACVAIEDSNTGATSAQAAGCVTVVVPNHVEVPDVSGRHRFDGLIGLSAADLAGLIAAGR